MHPHMHLRGKDMTYTATYPDGRSEIVLRVPKFDFGWQTDYWLAKPLTLPKGSKLHVSAHFDNSHREPAQPRSDGDGALGRSDVGRDDDRVLHLHGGGQGRPSAGAKRRMHGASRSGAPAVQSSTRRGR